jgi:hypothetical protein
MARVRQVLPFLAVEDARGAGCGLPSPLPDKLTQDYSHLTLARKIS